MTIADSPVAVDYLLVERIRVAVNRKLEDYERSNGSLSADEQRQMATNLIMRELETHTFSAMTSGHGVMSSESETAVSEAVLARMFGMGRIEDLLLIDGVEDIYIQGTNPVVVKYYGGQKAEWPPIAESDEDLLAQFAAIATHHGMNEREVTSARPFLNMDLPERNARLALIFGVTPHPIVTIRKHRFVNVTLEHLVQWGTISRPMQALLQAAVVGRRSILLVGPQSAGKTTMLRALCSCIGREERFATLETEFELLLHTIPGRFPLLVPVEERVGSGEKDGAGKALGEISVADVFPWTLRHSLERVVVGEVRSTEIISMLRAMSRGLRGSMATFHADSARETFESMASLLMEQSPALTYDAAMRQIATALDLVVFIDRETGLDATGMPVEIRYVTEILEVEQVSQSGPPSVNELFKPHDDPEMRELDPRGYPTGTGLVDQGLWARRAGMDLAWLTNKDLGTWPRPFPIRTLA